MTELYMKLNHSHIILHAFRSALLFVAGFMIYEILISLEKIWNLRNPNYKIYNFYQRKLLKFILIFIVDLIILYGIAIFLETSH